MYKPANEVILYVRALVLARFVIVTVVCGWSAVVPASDKLQFVPVPVIKIRKTQEVRLGGQSRI